MRRVNIALSDDQHKKSKILSVVLDESLNDFFSHAVDEHIKKHQNKLRSIP